MKLVEFLFWIGIFLVFYTYLGYGILLYLLVKIKETVKKQKKLPPLDAWPEVTLFIAAYNEENVVKEKMENCMSLSYPTDKLKIVWVTDGSTDNTNQLLSFYPQVTVLHESARKGKTAALNRGTQHITTPFVIFTDANTMLNKQAIEEIINQFSDPQIGCVAGEKRILQKEKESATAGEGIYWKYESTLKALDFRLYSAVGAAGELFAIRTNLFEIMPEDTLLDDLILSLRIAMKGYKIAYCSNAYALESASLNIHEEEKRKIRIAGGGLQSVWRLRNLLNPFRYGLLSFQYISHRVLRWTITPVFLFLLIPLNVILIFTHSNSFFYGIIFLLQLLFYGMAALGSYLEKKQLRNKLLFIPYYFLFMNTNVIKGFFFLRKNKGKGTWEKARREEKGE